MVKSAAAVGALGAARDLLAKPAKAAATGKVIGANDRINVGVIGVGGRGSRRGSTKRWVRADCGAGEA